MKKTIALVLSLMLLCAAFAALAENTAPLYATVGDALAAAGENPIAGGEDDYYAVITEENGMYYRSVAETDDRYNELQQAIWEAEPEQMEAAFAAVDEYVKTLPISYSEAFTAEPMSQADMDALVGKTLGDLREAGYEERESGTEGDGIAYVMRNGLFDYVIEVDADFDAYEKAQEDGSDGDFVIKNVSFRGITSEAVFKRFHTDGSVEEIADRYEGYADLMADVQAMITSVQNGEAVDADAFFNDLKEKYPGLADSVDMYSEMYQMLGADGIASMLTPEESVMADASDAFAIDYGMSDLYTQADMDEAIALINAEFSAWTGCEMHSLRYAGDEANTAENLAWMNELGEKEYAQVIEFLSDFHSPVEGGGAWEADTEYTDWQWWLAREEGGGWELLTWGY